MNSREKGKRGERQWRDELRANGYTARRGQQFSGSAESPDVVCAELDWMHFEVKAVERLNIEDAMQQAERDANGKAAVVAHRRNHTRWLVTMTAEFFFELVREFQPRMDTDEHGAKPSPGLRPPSPDGRGESGKESGVGSQEPARLATDTRVGVRDAGAIHEVFGGGVCRGR